MGFNRQQRGVLTPHAKPALRQRAGARFSILPILLAVFAGPAAARADSPSMASYWACAKSIGIAINDKFTILPAERAGEKGLYIYTDRSAFFLNLGAPDIESAEARDYFLRTEVPKVGEIFIGFHEARAGSEPDRQRGVSYQTTTPALSHLGKYRYTPVKEVLDERAKEVLSKRLKARVETIKAFLDDKNSYSTPAEAKTAFERDRVLYRAKLERCRLEQDRGLNWAVSEEVQKLDSGFPGVTIWEKEIGGKTSARRTQ